MATLTTLGAMPEKERAQYNDGWLGILSVFAFVWGLLNLAGLAISLTHTTESLSASYTQAQIDYLLSTPLYAKICHAVSVATLLIGAGYLQMRKQSSYVWFMISLFATLGLLLDGATRGGFDLLLNLSSGVSISYIIVGVFLFWATYSARQAGQLR